MTEAIDFTPEDERKARAMCIADGDDPERRIPVRVKGENVGTIPVWAAYLPDVIDGTDG